MLEKYRLGNNIFANSTEYSLTPYRVGGSYGRRPAFDVGGFPYETPKNGAILEIPDLVKFRPSGAGR